MANVTVNVDRLPQAFESVYSAELSSLCNLLRRMGVPSTDIEDLAHEVFFTALRRFDTYDASRPVRPWLFGIAFRQVTRFFERHRTRQRNEVHGSNSMEGEDTSACPEQELVAAQTRQLVLSALSALDLPRRSVLVLHDIDQLTAPEIAEVLMIPLNTVYSRLRSARQIFRGEFSRHDLLRSHS